MEEITIPASGELDKSPTDRLLKLAEGKIPSVLLEFSLPAIAAMLISALYNVADSIFVGKGVGDLGLAAVSIATPLMIMQMAVGIWIGVGGGSIIAIRLGEGRHDLAERTLGNMIIMFIITGILTTLVGLVFLDHILLFLGATIDILPLARTFSRIVLWGSLFMYLGYGLNPAVRNEGSPRMAMWASVIPCLLNVALNPLFIFTFKMGIAGSAWATFIAYLFGFIWNWLYYFSKRSILKIRILNMLPDWEVIRDTLTNGMSSFWVQILSSIVFFTCNNVVAKYGGDDAIAVFGVCMRVMMLMVLPLVGIYQGAQPLLGFNYGAENFQRVLKTLKLAVIAASIMSLTGCLVVQFLNRQIMELFTNDPVIVAMGSISLRIGMAMVWLAGFQVIAANFFQAINKPGYAMFFTLLRQGCLIVPLALILPHWLGINGVWMALPLTDMLATICTGWFFMREVRRMRAWII